MRSVLAAITGLDVTCVRGGAEGEAPSVTLMVRSTTAQRAVTHSVAVTFNPSTNRIADVKVRAFDLTEHVNEFAWKHHRTGHINLC